MMRTGQKSKVKSQKLKAARRGLGIRKLSTFDFRLLTAAKPPLRVTGGKGGASVRGGASVGGKRGGAAAERALVFGEDSVEGERQPMRASLYLWQHPDHVTFALGHRIAVFVD